MAREGRFGKLPRSAPDLSATIAQLLAEYAAQVDQNMVDAWQNGGKVDGKPVTDSRLLAHFKQRRDELTKGSPEWTEWNNRITQYEFHIEESKMTVKWDNGQVSEAGMAAFYSKWEKKTPDNTEFDRSLRSSYGKWMKSANARSAYNSAKAKAEAHQKWANDYYDKHAKVGVTANAWITNFMAQYGPLSDKTSGGQQAGAPPTNLGGLEANSAFDFPTLIALIHGKGLTPDQQAQIDAMENGWTDPKTGKHVKGLKEMDPTFEWSMDWFNKVAGNTKSALDTLMKKSTTDAERNMWGSTKTDVTISNNRMNVAPVVDDLKAAREEWESSMIASRGDPDAQRAATEKYAAVVHAAQKSVNQIGSFANPDRVDQNVIGGINSEATMLDTALSGGKITGTLEPTWLDSTAGGNSNSDAQGWVDVMNGMNDSSAKKNGGGWAVVGQVDDPRSDDPTKKITALIWHDASDPPPVGYEAVSGVAAVGGSTLYVAEKPVHVTVTGPGNLQTGTPPVAVDAQGNPVDKEGKPTNVGNANNPPVEGSDVAFFAVTVPGTDGADHTYYKAYQNDGKPVYFPEGEPPINSTKASLTVKTDPDGNPVVELHAKDPNTLPPGYRVSDLMSYGPHAAGSSDLRPQDVYTRDAKGNVTGTIVGSYQTLTGMNYHDELSKLNVSDPDYVSKRNVIMNAAQGQVTAAQNNAFRAGERGDTAGEKYWSDQANSMKGDFTNLMVYVTAQAKGDTTTAGQQNMADILKANGAVWDGYKVTGSPAVAQATAQDALEPARAWAVQQLNQYDAQWVGTSGPGQNMDQKTYDKWLTDHGIGLGATPPRASDVASGYDATQYSSLRQQIETTKDPRLLQLPTFVTGGVNNPALTGQSGQTVQLPNAQPAGVPAPGTQGAPSSTATPPPNTAATPPASQTTPPANTPPPPIPQPPTPPPPPMPYSRFRNVPI